MTTHKNDNSYNNLTRSVCVCVCAPVTVSVCVCACFNN